VGPVPLHCSSGESASSARHESRRLGSSSPHLGTIFSSVPWRPRISHGKFEEVLHICITAIAQYVPDGKIGSVDSHDRGTTE